MKWKKRYMAILKPSLYCPSLLTASLVIARQFFAESTEIIPTIKSILNQTSDGTRYDWASIDKTNNALGDASVLPQSQSAPEYTGRFHASPYGGWGLNSQCIQWCHCPGHNYLCQVSHLLDIWNQKMLISITFICLLVVALQHLKVKHE